MKALTTMQAAYWVGRQSAPPLGGMAAHLYAEFDGGELDIARLRQAVEALYLRHPLLRLRITDDGRQTIAPPGPRHTLHLDDWRHADETTLAAALAAKRQAKSTQLLPLEQGVPCDISLSLLPAGRSRLHVDLDMIAGDAMSFRLLMEDLTAFYHQCPPPLPMTRRRPISITSRNATPTTRCASGANAANVGGANAWRRCRRRRACCARRTAAAAIAWPYS